MKINVEEVKQNFVKLQLEGNMLEANFDPGRPVVLVVLEDADLDAVLNLIIQHVYLSPHIDHFSSTWTSCQVVIAESVYHHFINKLRFRCQKFQDEKMPELYNCPTLASSVNDYLKTVSDEGIYRVETFENPNTEWSPYFILDLMLPEDGPGWDFPTLAVLPVKTASEAAHLGSQVGKYASVWGGNLDVLLSVSSLITHQLVFINTLDDPYKYLDRHCPWDTKIKGKSFEVNESVCQVLSSLKGFEPFVSFWRNYLTLYEQHSVPWQIKGPRGHLYFKEAMITPQDKRQYIAAALLCGNTVTVKEADVKDIWEDARILADKLEQFNIHYDGTPVPDGLHQIIPYPLNDIHKVVERLALVKYTILPAAPRIN